MQLRATIKNMPSQRKGMMKLGLLLMAVVVAGLLATPSMRAQRYAGRDRRTGESDSSGAKVAGADVEATETATNFVTKKSSPEGMAHT